MTLNWNPNWDVAGFASEAITVAAASIGVTSATAQLTIVGREAKHGFFTVETAPLRFTYDGTTPSATVGHLVQAGENFEVLGITNLTNLRMFRTTATSASVYATYSR